MMSPNRSGVLAVTYRVIDEYGTVQPAGVLTLRADGSFTQVLTLEAARKGTDKDGRTYQIIVTATDHAGNAVTVTTSVMVAHNQ